MGKVINLKEYLLRRGRAPLEVSHGVVRGGREPTFATRLERIRWQLDKINSLMSELRREGHVGK